MTIEQLYSIYQQHPSVQTDTRKLKEGGLFFALRGDNFNGNEFALKALEAGAAYAVVDDAQYATDDRCILVDNVLTTLQDLARHHRKQFDIPFLAITGSNGKTTTKELITAVLRRKYVTYATIGNLNNHIGVPRTLSKIGQDAQMAVGEMGANHQKEIESYCTIALPTHGLITNVGKAHIEGFGGPEGVRKGKGELFDFLRDNNGSVFINTDLPYLDEMSEGISERITYGSTNAQYIGRPLTTGELLDVAILTSGAETTIHTQLVGDYNFPNVMAAVAIGLHFGISIDEIKIAIEEYQPDNSRSQLIKCGNNSIILDAYNANPTSMAAGIKNFASSSQFRDKHLWLGGMREMGHAEVEEHQALVNLVSQYPWQSVILVGKEFEGLQGNYNWFLTSADAAAYVGAHKPQNASILIKGSRGSKMEVMAEVL